MALNTVYQRRENDGKQCVSAFKDSAFQRAWVLLKTWCSATELIGARKRGIIDKETINAGVKSLKKSNVKVLAYLEVSLVYVVAVLPERRWKQMIEYNIMKRTEILLDHK